MRIVEHRRAHSRRIALMLALLASVLIVPVARAGGLPPGGLNLRASFAGARAWSGGPGVRSQSVSPAARAAVLAQGTGLTPSEVTTENVCGEPAAGRARCAAQILVLRGTHNRVHPQAPKTRTFTQVFPRVHRAGAPATPVNPAAAGLTAHSPAWLQQAYDLTYLSQTRASATPSRSSTPTTTRRPRRTSRSTARTTGCPRARPQTAASA